MERTGRVRDAGGLVMEVLEGGVSSATVRVDLPDGRGWVIKQALPRLRVEVEWFSDPVRIHREALAMSWLATVVPGSVPALIFEDEDEMLVAMEAVPVPHERWKDMLLRGEVEPAHVEQFGRLLAHIHSEGLADAHSLSATFGDRTFFESLRLEPYYAYSAAREPAAASFLKGLIAETRARPSTVVHGDYSPKNILVHDGTLVLIDHEVIHWGDGGFDVGFALTHFLAKSHFVSGKHQEFLHAARLFWETYHSMVRTALEDPEYERRVVRHTIGCTLARAVGRSTLEYLSTAQKRQQARTAITLAADLPGTVPDLIQAFSATIGGTA